jgi:hypothetical protein
MEWLKSPIGDSTPASCALTFSSILGLSWCDGTSDPRMPFDLPARLRVGVNGMTVMPREKLLHQKEDRKSTERPRSRV